VNDIENSTPKLKHDRYEMITHELESVKNRLRKMKNHYPWSEFNPLNSVELDEINKLNQEIDSLQQQIEKISLASQQSC
jgi:archaellum component FlaC